MNRAYTLPMLVSILLLTACGESNTESAQAVLETLKPCELLTAEDIQQVTGYAMKPGVELHKVNCSFESVETKGQFEMPKYRWFVMHVHQPATVEQIAKSDRDGRQEILGNDYHATPVSGIGDQAIWEQFSGVTQLTVYVADGSNATDTISIQPDFDGEEQALDQAKALALRALQRL